MIMVFNKIDLYREKYFDELLDSETKRQIEHDLLEKFNNDYGRQTIIISAATKENIDELRQILQDRIMALYQERYPYQSKQWS